MKTLKYMAVTFVTALTAVSFADDNFPQKDNMWYQNGLQTLQERLKATPITSKAKNIILFISDGNSIASNTAIRIYTGQHEKGEGEEYVLSYEHFPYTGLIKTYNTNAQTPDSAGTASAIMTGVKTKSGVSGVDQDIMRSACNDVPKHKVKTLPEVLKEQGKDIGIVTTARVTHATPAALYAHTSNRNYESSVPKDCSGQEDIALQMINWGYGDGLDLVFGGGRTNFIPNDIVDEEGEKGRRKDGQNLIEAWKSKSNKHIYIADQQGFDSLDTNADNKILALFNGSHMEYELDRAEDKAGEPSLPEMTKKAIEILQNHDQGYFLMVEAGRVDHAHHAGNASRALEDGRMFSEAIKIADDMTNDEDTLIIVTADHSHTMSLSGYAPKGNPILGLVGTINSDGSISEEPVVAFDAKPYTSISYANGPGSVFLKIDDDGHIHPREDLVSVDVEHKDFVQQALIPLESETHGTDDVAIYAKGPWAHLLSGVSEQNFIYHVMEYAVQFEGE